MKNILVTVILFLGGAAVRWSLKHTELHSSEQLSRGSASCRGARRVGPRVLFLVPLVTLLLFSGSLAQQDTLWTRRLSGSGNGQDFVTGVAADAEGNAYAVVRNRDARPRVITAKCSPDGALLWKRDFTGTGRSKPAGIALDHQGNVLVAASCAVGVIYPSDAALIKYTPEGETCWTRLFDLRSSVDSALALAIDDSDNIYVAGEAYSDSGRQDGLLMKYSSAGNLLWYRLFDGGNRSRDKLFRLLLDPDGDVFVAGHSNESFLALRYSRAGDLEWSKVLPYPGNNQLSDIALDSTHCLFLTGRTANFTDRDSSGLLTIKFSPAGETLWTRKISEHGRSANAVAVACDRENNAYVAGNLLGEWYFDAILVKYAPDGRELWRTSRADTAESLAAMCLLPTGRIYVTGFRQMPVHWMVFLQVSCYTTDGVKEWSGIWATRDSVYAAGSCLALGETSVIAGGAYLQWDRDTNAIIVRYSLTGRQQWSRAVGGPGTNHDCAYDVTFDSAGNVITAGYLDQAGEAADLAVAKFSPGGELLWLETYGNITCGEDVAKQVKTDATGNVYVLGYSEGDRTGVDYVTLKYDADGNRQWVQRYDGPAHQDDMPVALAVDRLGNVIVTGSSRDGNLRTDFATVKYSPSGQELWARRYNGSADSSDEAGGIAVDDSGNVYVAGMTREIGAWRPTSVIKYNSEGVIRWITRCANPYTTHGDFAVVGAGVDSAGNVCIGGYGYDWSRHFLVAKVSPAGETLWIRGVETGGFEWASAAAVDQYGRVVVVGDAAYETYDCVTAYFNADGTGSWLRTYNGTANSSDAMCDVAFGRHGAVYATGMSLSSPTSWDAITIGYDSVGRQVWFGRYASPETGFDGSWGVACDMRGRVAIVGFASSSLKEEYLVVLYEPHEGTTERPAEGPFVALASLDAAPNPFIGQTGIQLQVQSPARASLRVYDSSGRAVRTLLNCAVLSRTIDLKWDGKDNDGRLLPRGVYLLRLTFATTEGGSIVHPRDVMEKVVKE